MKSLNNQRFEKANMKKGGDEKRLFCVGFGQQMKKRAMFLTKEVGNEEINGIVNGGSFGNGFKRCLRS